MSELLLNDLCRPALWMKMASFLRLFVESVSLALNMIMHIDSRVIASQLHSADVWIGRIRISSRMSSCFVFHLMQ